MFSFSLVKCVFFLTHSVCQKKKCPNNKKEIYNDKYRHTRDRLFGLVQSENHHLLIAVWLVDHYDTSVLGRYTIITHLSYNIIRDLNTAVVSGTLIHMTT